MEIHGSSLNFSALRPNTQTEGKSDVVSKPVKHDLSTSEQQKESAQASSETPAAIEKLLANAGSPQFSSPAGLSTAFDIRKLNAINAYARQSNQPTLEQRAQLIAGIDLYV